MCSFWRKLFLNLSQFLFAILGILVMCSCNDLLTAYLAIELSSLAFYILASFRKVSVYSVESGIKYFIIGAISSAFFLLGSSFIYGAIGSINFSDFRTLFEESYFYIEPEFLLYEGIPIFKWLSILLELPIEVVDRLDILVIII